MRIIFALVLSLVGGWAFAQHDPDDYLLEKEDAIIRETERSDVRTAYMLNFLERRLTVLEHRYLSKDETTWLKHCKADPQLGALDQYTDDRLLRDYGRILHSLLVYVEGAFQSTRNDPLLMALEGLSKRSQKSQKILLSLQPSFGENDIAAQNLKYDLQLTQKAVDGAKKGIEKIKEKYR